MTASGAGGTGDSATGSLHADEGHANDYDDV
jgi:hypothetical protein